MIVDTVINIDGLTTTNENNVYSNFIGVAITAASAVTILGGTLNNFSDWNLTWSADNVANSLNIDQVAECSFVNFTLNSGADAIIALTFTSGASVLDCNFANFWLDDNDFDVALLLQGRFIVGSYLSTSYVGSCNFTNIHCYQLLIGQAALQGTDWPVANLPQGDGGGAFWCNFNNMYIGPGSLYADDMTRTNFSNIYIEDETANVGADVITLAGRAYFFCASDFTQDYSSADTTGIGVSIVNLISNGSFRFCAPLSGSGAATTTRLLQMNFSNIHSLQRQTNTAQSTITICDDNNTANHTLRMDNCTFNNVSCRGQLAICSAQNAGSSSTITGMIGSMMYNCQATPPLASIFLGSNNGTISNSQLSHIYSEDQLIVNGILSDSNYSDMHAAGFFFIAASDGSSIIDTTFSNLITETSFRIAVSNGLIDSTLSITKCILEGFKSTSGNINYLASAVTNSDNTTIDFSNNSITNFNSTGGVYIGYADNTSGVPTGIGNENTIRLTRNIISCISVFDAADHFRFLYEEVLANNTWAFCYANSLSNITCSSTGDIELMNGMPVGFGQQYYLLGTNLSCRDLNIGLGTGGTGHNGDVHITNIIVTGDLNCEGNYTHISNGYCDTLTIDTLGNNNHYTDILVYSPVAQTIPGNYLHFTSCRWRTNVVITFNGTPVTLIGCIAGSNGGTGDLIAGAGLSVVAAGCLTGAAVFTNITNGGNIAII
jgi:hypothetical protein